MEKDFFKIFFFFCMYQPDAWVLDQNNVISLPIGSDQYSKLECETGRNVQDWATMISRSPKMRLKRPYHVSLCQFRKTSSINIGLHTIAVGLLGLDNLQGPRVVPLNTTFVDSPS